MATAEGAAESANALDCFVADSLIKLQNALPRLPGETLEPFVEFQSLMLGIASLLDNRGVGGLGDRQQLAVQRAAHAMLPIARAALVQPLARLTPGVLDLLRSLAKGTARRDAEYAHAHALRAAGRSAEGLFSPSTVQTHRYVNYADVANLVGGLTSAEHFYETCYAGYQRLERLLSAEYWPVVDHNLPRLTSSMVAWAVPLLFDGLRLRRGLEVAAPCGTLEAGQRAPFGLQSMAVVLLSDGETSVDRERVGRAAQFLIAAAEEGLAANPPGEPSCAEETVRRLQARLQEDLETCRKEVETRCLVPGKSMRLILDRVVALSEDWSPANRMFFQYALAYPCLVPKNLRHLHGYDGGLLSVWDACNHLLKLHAQEHAEVLPFHALLCAVLGGVVGGLVSETVTGPFCVHPDTEVFRKITAINDSWPSCAKKCDAMQRGTGKRPASGSRGKQVGATAAICDTIERKILKPEQQRTPAVDARFDGALTMHVITTGMAQLPGVFDSRPSDGIVPLKRLYFAALHRQPGTPAPVDTSALVDPLAGTAQPDSIEMAWREIAGGALLSTGPLFCFSRQGFHDSLQEDWKPRPAVARALEAREQPAASERAPPVMLPSEAMQLMACRAQRRAADVAAQVDNVVKSVAGPPFVTRVVDMLNAWSNMVYAGADYNPLWEVSIAHFGCPTNGNKRARPVSPGHHEKQN